MTSPATELHIATRGGFFFFLILVKFLHGARPAVHYVLRSPVFCPGYFFLVQHYKPHAAMVGLLRNNGHVVTLFCFHQTATQKMFELL